MSLGFRHGLTGAALALAGLFACTGSEWVEYRREPPKLNLDLTIDNPPQITLMVVAPLQTDVGQWVGLSADAVDPEGDKLQFLWTGKGGRIGKPMAQETRFTCTQPGVFKVGLSVSDPHGLHDDLDVRVTCVK